MSHVLLRLAGKSLVPAPFLPETHRLPQHILAAVLLSIILSGLNAQNTNRPSVPRTILAVSDFSAVQPQYKLGQ